MNDKPAALTSKNRSILDRLRDSQNDVICPCLELRKAAADEIDRLQKANKARAYWLDGKRFNEVDDYIDEAERQIADLKKQLTAKQSPDETSELQRALQIIDACGALSDWINRARPVITELMDAYERRVRSHPDFRPEDAAKRPWACMEYVAAEALLRDQPVAVVEISAQKA